jgi:hypothetical protein
MSDRYKGAILSPTAPTVIPQSAGGVYTLSQQLQYQGQGVWPSAINNPVNNSLRFRSSASAYLNRTPSVTGSQRVFTWSGWVKLGQLGTYQGIFGANQGNGYGTTQKISSLNISNTNTLRWTEYYSADGISTNWSYSVETTPVYRDPSAWYHIVVAVDYTQATASNRVKLYVNGSQVTALATANYPPQNFDSWLNTTSTQHQIGYFGVNPYYYFDGYLTEVNFIDGQALTPSSFGTTDVYGIWQPIPYTGTYGTNGFYLPFTDNSALTTSSNVGLGKDFSGNGNYWVTNNISITAGSTYDSMKDVPTNTNATTANYPTLNPLSKSSSSNLSNGNLSWSSSAYNYQGATSTTALPSSGKWYWETFITTGGTATSDDMGIGVQALSLGTAPKDNGGGGGITNGAVIVSRRDSGSRLVVNNSTVQSGTLYSFTTNDIIQVAFDADSGKIWFGKNNSYFDASGGTTGNPGSGTNQVGTLIAGSSYLPVWDGYTNTYVVAVNFGQRPFSYTPPTGFYPLNTYNLPTPTILDGDQYFNAVTYTGTSGTQAVTGVGFQPDWVWIKARNSTLVHVLQDAVRGTTAYLQSNSSAAENTNTANNWFRSFDSDGFTVATLTSPGGVSTNEWNNTGYTYVSWNWKASNAAGVSNTQGTITSTVSANPTAGFSIVTFTTVTSGTSSVGHGLGVTPSFVIFKTRSTTSNWICQHTSTGTQYLLLNGTGAAVTDSTVWNSAPTSSVVNMGTGFAGYSGATAVMYCFAAVSGYSAFGSYASNNSADGPFIYTGFRPRYVMIKAYSNAGEDWNIFDSARGSYNVNTAVLFADSSSAELTNSSIDFLSNGFKLRSATGGVNYSSYSYIYAAFAENPFKIARGR